MIVISPDSAAAARHTLSHEQADQKKKPEKGSRASEDAPFLWHEGGRLIQWAA